MVHGEAAGRLVPTHNSTGEVQHIGVGTFVILFAEQAYVHVDGRNDQLLSGFGFHPQVDEHALHHVPVLLEFDHVLLLEIQEHGELAIGRGLQGVHAYVLDHGIDVYTFQVLLAISYAACHFKGGHLLILCEDGCRGAVQQEQGTEDCGAHGLVI